MNAELIYILLFAGRTLSKASGVLPTPLVVEKRGENMQARVVGIASMGLRPLLELTL